MEYVFTKKLEFSKNYMIVFKKNQTCHINNTFQKQLIIIIVLQIILKFVIVVIKY